MRSKFFLIPSALLFQVVGAQTGAASLTPAQGNVTVSVSAATTEPTPPPAPAGEAAAPGSSGQISYLDYTSVYEAATIEEEVKMAAERFSLTAAQQDIWLTAATDRRVAEKMAREKLDSKNANYEREGVYRGLRSAQNTFHETVTGYLTPSQKQALETDRLILQEKQKKLAKLPPPPPPAPTVTTVPIDSAAIKESEKAKEKGKKSKKKKKSVG